MRERTNPIDHAHGGVLVAGEVAVSELRVVSEGEPRFSGFWYQQSSGALARMDRLSSRVFDKSVMNDGAFVDLL